MNRSCSVIIIGAGGHAAVVADALIAAGRDILGFTDADPARHGLTSCGCKILGDDRALESYNRAEIELGNGLGGRGHPGDPPLRRAVQLRLAALGWRFTGVRHPSATVSPFATIHATAQVMAGCRIQPGVAIGEGCIVNTSAVIEHDVQLESWIHVAPAAVLCGGVRVGGGSHIGAGAIVRQGIRLGEETIVAAGAVVVRDFAGRGLLVGVPARTRERH